MSKGENTTGNRETRGILKENEKHPQRKKKKWEKEIRYQPKSQVNILFWSQCKYCT